MNIFGKIEGRVWGDYVRLEPSHNVALVEVLLGEQAKKTLDEVRAPIRDIVIFRGRDFQGDYIGWRTGHKSQMDPSMEIVAEHSL